MRPSWIIIIVIVTITDSLLFAQQQTLQQQLRQQQKEIDYLKQELRLLKAKNTEDTSQSKEELDTPLWDHPIQGKISNFKVTLLGFLYAQFAYDNHDPNQRHLSVLDEDIGNDSTRFDIDTTRIGLEIEAQMPEWNSQLKGLLEIDFRPGDEELPAGRPRFRHAYIEFTNPVINVLFGQSWTIIARNGPDSINNDWLFHLGNPGDRFPQLRLGKEWTIGTSSFTLETGIIHFNDFAPGEDDQIQQSVSQYEFRRYVPQFQARTAFKWHKQSQGYIALGISAGPLHIKDRTTRIEDRVTHWWFASELHLPLGPITFSGEFWLGQAIGYGAGIGQAIVLIQTNKARAIPAIGGWLQLTVHPIPTLRVNAICGIDDSESRITNVSIAKDKNLTYMGNIIWDIFPYWTLAIEYQYVSTRYGNGRRPNNSRILLASFLRF